MSNSSDLYTRAAGAQVVRTRQDYMTIYAVRSDLGTYVGLPEGWWLYELGFVPCSDVQIVDRSFLNGMQDEGIIVMELQDVG